MADAPAPTLEALLASPDRFRTWLESKPADEAVGEADCPARCPLHSWLKQASGWPGLHGMQVTPTHVEGFGWLAVAFRITLPAWAMDFVCRVDSEGGIFSAAEALAALATVTADA